MVLLGQLVREEVPKEWEGHRRWILIRKVGMGFVVTDELMHDSQRGDEDYFKVTVNASPDNMSPLFLCISSLVRAVILGCFRKFLHGGPTVALLRPPRCLAVGKAKFRQGLRRLRAGRHAQAHPAHERDDREQARSCYFFERSENSAMSSK